VEHLQRRQRAERRGVANNGFAAGSRRGAITSPARSEGPDARDIVRAYARFDPWGNFAASDARARFMNVVPGLTPWNDDGRGGPTVH